MRKEEKAFPPSVRPSFHSLMTTDIRRKESGKGLLRVVIRKPIGQFSLLCFSHDGGDSRWTQRKSGKVPRPNFFFFLARNARKFWKFYLQVRSIILDPNSRSNLCPRSNSATPTQKSSIASLSLSFFPKREFSNFYCMSSVAFEINARITTNSENCHCAARFR